MNTLIDIPPAVTLSRGQRISRCLERYLLPVGLALYILANFLPISGKATNNVFYVLGALPALLWVFLNSKQLRQAGRAFSLFWGFMLVYAIWGALHPQSLSPKPVLYLTLLFFALWATRQPEARVHFRLFAWLAFLAGVALLGTSFQWLQRWSADGVAPRIVLWDDQNPLRTSMLICTALAWSWLFVLEPRLTGRPAALKAAAFLMVLLLMAWTAVVFQSRSALLGVAAFLGLLLITRRGPGLSVFLVVVLVAGVFGWFLGWHEVLAERGLSYRMEIWQDAWQRLQGVCGLWMGCGDDGYLFLQRYTHPHGAYWSLLYEHGAVVFFLFIACALTWLVQGLRYRSRWLLVAVIGWGGVLTTTGGVIHSPSPYWIYFWMPTFLAMIECQAAKARQV